jgi:hypothetical protein
MTHVDRPAEQGQATDPPEPRTRSSALRLTAEEVKRVRIAVRKVAAAMGGFKRLATMMEVPPSTVYYAARPNGRTSAAFAIRLAAVAKVPVEVLLTGKLAVQPPLIGVAA